MKYLLLILLATMIIGCGKEQVTEQVKTEQDIKIEYLLYVEAFRKTWKNGAEPDSYTQWRDRNYGTKEEKDRAYNSMLVRESLRW